MSSTMLALKHLVFCVSVFAVYADVVFDNWKKPPDNNPDLNRKDLGAMQDAWKTIKCMTNQSYYLIYSSGRGTRKHYPHMSCLQVQTSDLNNTLKSAKYTSKWYDTKSKTMKSSTQSVQAVKQKDYSIENIMHLGQPQRKATSPNGTCYNLNFNFLCESGGCRIPHQECWRPRWTKYSEKYVVFSTSLCYIVRSLQDEEDYESCEFWLRGDWLKNNVTIPQVVTIVKKEGSEKIEESAENEESGKSEEREEREEKEESKESKESVQCEEEPRNANKTTYLYDSLFKELPSSCRYAFLLNCGYPTYRIYDKEDCDKINKSENETSDDANKRE
uniref:Putative lipocalin n=1 Tax=Ixodes ricinus TaxID=34613 RepID=A0A6B0V8A3_IXORI